ncbi:MAG TPA: 5-deoxy-glucuronate isomerase [Anaerolineaceae bacterium]
MKYTAENLIIHSNSPADHGLINAVDPARAGWDYLHFESRGLAKGQSWSCAPGACEMALVVFSGALRAVSNHGEWPRIGQRISVFAGLPEALYLPLDSTLTVQALEDSQFALAWAAAETMHPARLITQRDVTVEIRGGDNVTRQINGIIRPGFGCDRLVVVEVYTPSGNWSSYPPHKHDVHRVDASGRLLEADLEEIYYYKVDQPEGYALQHIYTGQTSPLEQAGQPIDAVLIARSDDLVLVPEGYHPVVSAPGYTSYYLNILAGSAQALTGEDDPQYAWVKETYTSRDPRVPIYPVDPGQFI